MLLGPLEPLAWGQPPWARLAQRCVLGFPWTPLSRVPRAPALQGGCCLFIWVFFCFLHAFIISCVFADDLVLQFIRVLLAWTSFNSTEG